MRLLVTGASGQLGSHLLRELQGGTHEVTAWCHSRGGELFGFPLRPVDLTNRDATAAAFRQARPVAVLHCAAYPSIADCYRHPERAADINGAGTILLAELASEAKARLIYTSTDLVFDGTRGNYGEGDDARPLSVYATSKLVGEKPVRTLGGLVVRISLMFGPSLIGNPYFFDQQLAKMRAGQATTWFEDEWRSPLGLAAAAKALLALIESELTGLLHLAGPERMSRFDMGRRLAAIYGLDPSLAVAVPQASVATPEPRPHDVSLDCAKWRSLFPRQWWPTWEEYLTADAITGG